MDAEPSFGIYPIFSIKLAVELMRPKRPSKHTQNSPDAFACGREATEAFPAEIDI